MSRMPAEVDALGNINLHLQEGLSIPVRDEDVNGDPINLSARVWKFKTATLTKTLVVDPNNALGKLLVLTQAELQALPGTAVPFVVVDETSDPDDVRWEGVINKRGWQ